MPAPSPIRSRIALGLAVGWLVLAWTLRARTIGDLDSSNFIYALDHFDLSRNMPHFPGYPVYVALARLCRPVVGGDPIASLQLPGLAGLAGALYLLWLAVRRHAGDAAAFAAMAFAGGAPLLFLMAGRASSDALGTALWVSAMSLLALAWPRAGVDLEPRAERRLLDAAGVVLGLTLGARPSYFPLFFAAAALLAFHPRRRLWGLVLGVAAWSLPFAVIVGPELPELAGRFLAGHMGHWGGTVLVTGGPVARLGDFASQLAVHGLAMPIAGGSPMRWVLFPLFVGAAVLGFAPLDRRSGGIALLLALPYALWLWLGQNPEKPRHLLPLIPLLAVGAGLGVGRLCERRGAAIRAVTPAAAALALLAVTVPLGLRHKAQPSPEAQMAEYLAAHYPVEGTQVFSGPSERVTSFYRPGFRIEYAPDRAEVERRLARLPHRPPVLLVTDEVRDVWGKRVATFVRDPLVDMHRPSISLYEVSR